MARLSTRSVDAALDALDDDTNPGRVLADLLDGCGGWDWDDVPCDRLAIVESSGAVWCVYRGTESDHAWRFETRDEAQAKFDDIRR